MADYPTTIFNASASYQIDNVDDAEAEDINKLYDEVEGIESELGILAKKGGESSLAGFASISKGIYMREFTFG